MALTVFVTEDFVTEILPSVFRAEVKILPMTNSETSLRRKKL
jgi:hypothetical protein